MNKKITSALHRKKTRTITVGKVKVGGNNPIAVQSMTTTETKNVSATVSQIKKLENAGLEIVRVAITDKNDALSISKIKKKIKSPIIADIHFDYRLALLSLKNGADALRINPGNIGGKKKIKEVINCANDFNAPIRIGVNAGSLEKDIEKKFKNNKAKGMLKSAERSIDIFASLGFENIKVSLKASSVLETIKAYRLFSEKFDFPLHLGITESGTINSGLVKSSIGIGFLLYDGIGDTIRVSLSSDPIYEVKAAYDILRVFKIRERGPEFISCPTCGRCKINLFSLINKIEKKLSNSPLNIKIAVMGCVVNGPGEAKDADIGIAGTDGKGIIFKKGKIVKKIPYDELYEEFLKELK